MISFPGVSSLETPRSAWSRGRQPQGRGSPSGSGCPQGSRPLPALPCPPLFPQWKSRDGGSQPRGGSEFPWPPSGSVNFSPSSSAPLAPRGRICARSVGQPSARVCAGRSRPYLPRGVWKPMGANTPRGTRAGGERGLPCAARVGRGLFAAPPCLCASFCA